MTEDQVKKLFTFDHLPPYLQEVSVMYHDEALRLHNRYPSAEGTLAIRKLWEAKNLAVWCAAQ